MGQQPLGGQIFRQEQALGGQIFRQEQTLGGQIFRQEQALGGQILKPEQAQGGKKFRSDQALVSQMSIKVKYAEKRRHYIGEIFRLDQAPDGYVVLFKQGQILLRLAKYVRFSREREFVFC